MATDTDNFVRIDGWVTPRAEDILRRAAVIATERGYHYLGVEHLALALTEDPDSLPAHLWTEPMTMTQWQQAITDHLPSLPADSVTDHGPVTVTAVRHDPAIVDS